MVDYTDDWMNPKTSISWSYEAPKDGRSFLIQRERLIPTTGYGRVTEWELWSEHKSQEERDKELSRLGENQPLWHLRPATKTVTGGHVSVDIENEREAALLRRIDELEKAKRRPRRKAVAS